jgi:hypothetical protein
VIPPLLPNQTKRDLGSQLDLQTKRSLTSFTDILDPSTSFTAMTFVPDNQAFFLQNNIAQVAGID